MPLLSKAELRSLTETQSSLCISIYLPTHEAGNEIQQDHIRLKNRLSEAESQLSEKGLNDKEILDLLKPATDLVDNGDFWRHQSGGLALFITADLFRSYRVPLSFEELTIVGEQFYTKPLLPLIANNGQFYVLAASQNKVTLYQATRDSVQQVNLGDTPESIDVALRFDDPQESIQSHSNGRSGSVSGGSAVFNGQGGGKDSENSDILRFFHLVSDGVEEAITGQTAPLVFMGVEFLFPLYKQANKYPHLIEKAVDYQPDQLSPEEIRDRALEVVEPQFEADRKAAADEYGSLQDKDQATADLELILNAAFNGQIDTLFISKNSQQWGMFDTRSRKLIYQDEQTEGSEELLNMAAIQALATDAEVYVVEQSEMPIEGAAAATLRYPIMNPELVSA